MTFLPPTVARRRLPFTLLAVIAALPARAAEPIEIGSWTSDSETGPQGRRSHRSHVTKIDCQCPMSDRSSRLLGSEMRPCHQRIGGRHQIAAFREAG